MEIKCKDCVYVLNLRQDVTELKTDVKDVDKRVGDMEVGAGETKEQMKTIFNNLSEIKGDVKEIKNSKSKFLSGIASGVAIAIIAAFLLQAFRVFHW
jgi:peptidoglycan hydrolase CwlO-like protein